MIFNGRRNKSKHIDKLQQQQPYEAPINVRQICNLPYGTRGLMTDYYEPMALVRGEAAPDRSAMHVAIVVHDNPYEGTRYDAAPLAMEMARRGMAVFVPSLSEGVEGNPFFMQQIADLLALLSDIGADRHHLHLVPETYGRAGNKVVLVGCGTGAMLAGVCLRLHHDARARDYFGEQCPAVRDYFSMGATPTVDFEPLVRIGGFVSMSGNVHPMGDSYVYNYDRWLGRGFTAAKIYTYLDFSRWFALDYPPVLLVAGGADTNLDEARSVMAAAPAGAVRLLELPREDAEGHVLENLFWARYPLWEKSKEVNSQIVTYIRNL